MTEFIKFELKNNIARVAINRPKKKNALTLEMLQKLSDVGERLKSESDLLCVLITGKDGIFSSGIDITNFATLANNKTLLNSLMATG